MIEFDLLTDIIEELTGLTRDELVSKKRLRTLVELRMVCASILRDYSQKKGRKLTVFQIGDILNVDHSSISYYSTIHYNLISDFNSNKNRNYRTLYEQIKSAFDIRIISCDTSFMLKNRDRRNVYLEKRKMLGKEIEMIDEILFSMNKIELKKA